MSILRYDAFPKKPRFVHIGQMGNCINRASYCFPDRVIFFQMFMGYQLEQDRVSGSKILEADISSSFHGQSALLLAGPLKVFSLALCSVSEQDTA